MTQLPPVTPAELLQHEFMQPLGMDAATLAGAMDAPLALVGALLQGQRRVDAELDQRLGKVLGTGPG